MFSRKNKAKEVEENTVISFAGKTGDGDRLYRMEYKGTLFYDEAEWYEIENAIELLKAGY